MMHFFDINNIAFQIPGYPISYVELIGTLFGLISVYFASRANILTWSTGIVNELFLFVLFFQVQLYADMFLQVYFFIVTLFGWYNWKTNKAEKSITQSNTRTRLLFTGALVLGTLIVGMLIKNIHTLLPVYFTVPAAYPFADSFVMVASIIATVLLASKRVENWLFWIVGNVVCVVMYYKKAVYFLSLEYCLFLGLAAYGYYHWNQQLKK